MRVDTTSPGFVVTVITLDDERRIQGRKDPKALGKLLEGMTDMTERITSFTYEDSENELDVLKLVVDNHDLLFFDSPAWVKGNLVRFFFGYPGRIFGPRFAVVDNVRGFRTLTVTCMEQTALANVGKNRLFKNTTKLDIVQKIVAEGGIPGVKAFSIEGGVLLNEKPRDFSQAAQTDWQFLLRLAEKAGYEIYVEDDVLHFHPRRLSARPQRTFHYFFGEGDLIKFSVREFRVTDRPAETEVRGHDPIERKTIAETGSNKKTNRPTLGNQGILVLKANETGALVAGTKIVATPERDTAVVKNEADMHFKRAEQGEVKATATIIGDPLLPAKSVIKIEGISRTLSGLYYVKKHIHKLTMGGYVGALTLIKNALTATPAPSPPSLDKTKANENRTEPTTDRRNKLVKNEDGSLRQVATR